MTAPSAISIPYIQAGLIYPYVNNAGVYKCPADRTVFPIGSPLGQPRVQACLWCWFIRWISGFPARPLVSMFPKTGDLNIPGPSTTFVFIDGEPNSIDDGYFAVNILQTNFWVNTPATYHNHAGGLSYADGHARN